MRGCVLLLNHPPRAASNLSRTTVHSIAPHAGSPTIMTRRLLPFFVLLFGTSLAFGQDWSQCSGDKLDARWKVDVGGGYSGIAVVEGRLFTMDRQAKPSEVERVLCFDTANG